MKNSMNERAVQMKRKKGIRRKWKKVVSILSAIVVFITTYALILPAITIGDPEEANIHVEQPTRGVADESIPPTTGAADESIPPTTGAADETILTKETGTGADTSPEIKASDDVPTTPEVTIIPNLPTIGYPNVTYDLSDVTATPDKINGEAVTVRVTNVSCEGGTNNYELGEGMTTLTPHEDNVTFTVTYNAYIYEGGAERIVGTATHTLKIQGSKDIGECLDSDLDENGNCDWAYISEAGVVPDASTESGLAIRTGNEPFDEAEGPGCDTTDKNSLLRSFDLAQYTVFFKSKVRDDAPCSAYRTGTLHFEFILPCDSNQARFETESMGWLTAKRDAEYERIEGFYEGAPCQALKGSFLWEPSPDNPAAIGSNSYQELNVVVRALQLYGGNEEGRTADKLKPLFTFWLEGNKVCQNEGDLVTGSGFVCPLHDEIEYRTIEPPAVTITSAPRYNVKLTLGHWQSNQALGEFDFSTGADYAPNKDGGRKTYGRVKAFGAIIQIVGRSGRGLLGCEVPDEAHPITFDLKLTDSFTDNENVRTEVCAQGDHAGFFPLLWSVDESKWGYYEQGDGRALDGVDNKSLYTLPLNRFIEGNKHFTCNNGGNWRAVQDGSTISVTVSGYSVDLTRLPSCNIGEPVTTHRYYNPDKINGYWDVVNACFSAGEFWIVQPFYAPGENDGKGEHVLEHFNKDGGQFQISIEDVNLQVQSLSGPLPEAPDNNSNQIKINDDNQTAGYLIENEGTISTGVLYTDPNRIAWSYPLTEGCQRNGKDWIMRGNRLGIHSYYWQSTAEGDYVAVACDHLVKFDDAFFQPVSATNQGADSNDNVCTLLYGVKADGSAGWDHKGKSCADPLYDQDMKNATAQDLVFYESLEEIPQGQNCIAVLQEYRHVKEGSTVSTDLKIGIAGISRTGDGESGEGNVYMLTHWARAWNKNDVREAAALYCEKPVEELTDQDYENYVRNEFPSRKNQTYQTSPYDGDNSPYPDAFSKYDITHVPRLNYTKSGYNEYGYIPRSCSEEDSYNYGDSCLVVGYAAKIEKHTAQIEGGDNHEKRSYDMDTGQRVADYVIYPSAERAAGDNITPGAESVTDIYIEDTLPQGLTYINGSSYWIKKTAGGEYEGYDGKYEQTGPGKQGNIIGGHHFDESASSEEFSITFNDDGTATLKWTLKNVTVTGEQITDFGKIYYSCDIGTPGNEKTDVSDNDQLKNTVKIWSSNDQTPDFTEKNGNLKKISILISKNNAVSICKTAEQAGVDLNESMGFILHVGNNSDNVMENVIALDTLPYRGDAGHSDFSGKCRVTELSIDKEVSLDFVNESNGNFKFYYTLDESERTIEGRHKSSSDYNVGDFQDSSVWIKLEYNQDTGRIILPEGGFEPVAVAAVGDLPSMKTLKMHISLELPDGKPGDYIANRLTRGDMESIARSFIISRVLDGLVWLDCDADGLRQSDEVLLEPGVKVTLMKLTEGGNADNLTDYEVYKNKDGTEAVLYTGRQMDVYTGSSQTYPDGKGKYRFVNLPPGIYAVKFESGTGSETADLMNYAASPVDADEDGQDTMDSDGVPDKAYPDQLTYAFIADIDMPVAGNIPTLVYVSKYHDLGLSRKWNLTVYKVAEGDSNIKLPGAVFGLYSPDTDEMMSEDAYDGLDISELGLMALPTKIYTDEDGKKWYLRDVAKTTDEGMIVWECLRQKNYLVIELEAPEGYCLQTAPYTVTHSCHWEDGAVELLVENTSGYELPETGGIGAAIFYIGGPLLMAIAVALLIAKKSFFVR